MTMPPTLLAAWKETVAAAPSATALVEANTGHIWTREELDRAANDWHGEFGGVVRDRTVALAEPNGPDWLRVFLGSLKANAVIVPLDSSEPPAALRATAMAVRASHLWHTGQLAPLQSDSRASRGGHRLIKLTSGSTGAPRALAFTDAQMLADGRQICAGMNIAAGDINLGVIPWGHSYGQGNLVLPLLIQGTAIIFGAAPLPHAIAAAVANGRATVFPAVPALLRALVAAEVDIDQLATLRTVISAGAPLAPEIATAFFERFRRKIHSFYGSSETGGITYDPSGESAATGRGVGRPLPGVRLEFGSRGRFTVASPAVFTIGNRTPGKCRLADIGRVEPDGELVLLGRAGRLVKIAGRRLNLAEVERALRQIPGVRDALVIPHGGRAESLAAAVASDQPAAELARVLREQLAPWKIPRKWIVLHDFPLTLRGKTDTRRLRQLLSGVER